ncbi:hypothetical protein BMF94_1975 [Rhodotorula taiwanensis]|uniref:Small ribosomal subunit protein uS15 N-terminal domain-containing protein n=1 Tax=Rhodotorula taiwanensis TaxID=741276 RepID=A0A2S5BE03_9BASI|nr:hypothetical protein BMF94_1975 [Rhodotorula taiwanensis]
MGRMHNPHKGIASSALPYKRSAPRWLKTSPEEVKEHIFKASLSSRLPVTIKTAGLAPQIPEDLYHASQTLTERKKRAEGLTLLIKKAVQVRKHLERNRHDKDSKFRLILIESRIHRLARYYRTKGQLPPTFKYESATASTMIA